MTSFYKDKDNIYLDRNIINDPELSLTAKGVYAHLVFLYPSSVALEELMVNKNDDLEEIKEGINQLLDKNIITNKGWKYQANPK